MSKFLTATAAAGALAATALSLTACGTPTVTSSPSSGASSGDASGSAAKPSAHVGSTIDLTGNASGEKLAVTLVRLHRRVSGSEFETPQPGDRFAGIQLRLRNVGTATFSDSVSNDVVVFDKKGQSYESTIASSVGCTQFASTERLAPGESGLGCVLFEVPVSAKIARVQVTLDSGFADQTGEWKVR
jgi:hypothetical protein